MVVKLPTTKNVDMYTAKQYPDLWTGGNPKGAIIHNDAGRMSALDYISWLKSERTPNTSKAELGFANYYIDRNNIVRVATTTIGGYAAANPYYNKNFLHYEVCQQLGANDADWLANERAVFMQVAEDFHYYGLKASKDTVVLHHDVSLRGTSCPQRSMQTHGGNYPAVRQYFINQVAYYMSLGKTVKDMVNALNKAQNTTVTVSNVFKKGDIVELKDSASHWIRAYEKVGGENRGRTYISDALHKAQFKVTYLNSDGTVELAEIVDGKTQKERYVAYERDLVKAELRLYTVQTGAFASKNNATKKAEELKKEGHETFIIEK